MSQSQKPRIQRLFLWSFTAGISFCLAALLQSFFIKKLLPSTKIVSVPLIDLPVPKRASKESIATIGFRDIFKNNEIDNGEEQKEEVIIETGPCFSADTKTNLSLKLDNTVVLQDSLKSLASMIYSNQPKPRKMREGDEIPQILRVGKIAPNKVVFRNLKNGKCQYVENKQLKELKYPLPDILNPVAGKKVISSKTNNEIKSVGNKFTIKRSFLDEKLKNIQSVLNDARAISVPQPDGSLCFNIQEVDPEGVFPTLDIQNGDNICKINNRKITSYKQVMDLYGKLKTVPNIKLEIERNGQKIPKDYSIE